jgi:hypothetical protein
MEDYEQKITELRKKIIGETEGCMTEIAMNTLEIGTNGKGKVVVNHPDLEPDENGVGHIVFSVEQARNLANLLMSRAADAAVERGDLKTNFVNHSRRLWSEEECRIFVNAAVAKLIDDAGGLLTIAVSDMLRLAQKGTLAMALSDDDKVLTLTRVKEA